MAVTINLPERTGEGITDIEAAEAAALAAIEAQEALSIVAVADAVAGIVTDAEAAPSGELYVATQASLTAIGAAEDAILTPTTGTLPVAEAAALDAVEAAAAAQAAIIQSLVGATPYASTADAVSNGVIGLTGLVAGSGGTNGTFALAFSGGGGTGAAGYFVVAGGIVTSLYVTAKGRGYTSAPTVSFSASSGLTGASVTAVIGVNQAPATYFLVKVTNGFDVRQVDGGGTTATTIDTLPNLPTATAATAVGVTGAFTNVGFDTLTQTGLNTIAAVETAAAYSYGYQALAASVAAGGKLTVFYRASVGSGAGTRVSLFRPGTGIISATPALTRDDTLRSVVLTNTHGSLAATNIAFDSNGISSWEVSYFVVPGDLAETTPSVAALINTLMSMATLMTKEVVDSKVRNTGLLNGIAVNTSMDTLTINGLGDLTFVEATATSYARSPISTVLNTAKATLIYRVIPPGTTPATGQVRAALERFGSGSASSTVALIPDGLVRSITFTATQDANRILWDATAANQRVLFALIPGDVTETSPSVNGLQASILALANVLAAPVGGETWTDDDKLIFWPTPVAFVTGREVTVYGRQIVKGRFRQQALDVSLVSPASEGSNDVGFARFMSPQVAFKGEALSGASCFIDVKDPLVPAQIKRKTFTRRLAAAAQTGTVLFTMLGDSTAALGLPALAARVNASGATFTGKGTLTSGGISYEGRSGWTALNYLGKSRPAVANPFLRSLSVAVPAELAIITANSTICFADDAGYGTGVRPSYAEDATKSSYSIFDWDYWRQNGAVGLTGTEKLRVGVQLGRNGTSSATWIADNELAHTRIVENFRATFPNGTIFVISEALGEATDTANSLSAPAGYRDRTRALIANKMKLFSNREADRVWLVPAWAMQNAYAAMVLNAASSTDTDTGTTTHTVNDVVHYTAQLAIQWAEAVLGPLLYVHETT